MRGETGTLELTFFIPKSPDAVRRWWTDLPDDYRATDPREQPFRIVTLERRPEGRHVKTYWRMPDGSEIQLRETMTLRPDGTWSFDVPNSLGLDLRDEFRAESEGDGTRLHIHSTLTARNGAGEAEISQMKKMMEENWRTAAEICGRDAS